MKAPKQGILEDNSEILSPFGIAQKFQSIGGEYQQPRECLEVNKKGLLNILLHLTIDENKIYFSDKDVFFDYRYEIKKGREFAQFFKEQGLKVPKWENFSLNYNGTTVINEFGEVFLDGEFSLCDTDYLIELNSGYSPSYLTFKRKMKLALLKPINETGAKGAIIEIIIYFNSEFALVNIREFFSRFEDIVNTNEKRFFNTVINPDFLNLKINEFNEITERKSGGIRSKRHLQFLKTLLLMDYDLRTPQEVRKALDNGELGRKLARFQRENPELIDQFNLYLPKSGKTLYNWLMEE